MAFLSSPLALAQVSYTKAELQSIYRLSPLPKAPALPKDSLLANAKTALLGQHFFYDKRFSGNGNEACSSCHQPNHAFTDGLPIAKGMGTGTRNAPTVLNAALNDWQFWDGCADSLWEQALQPMENPVEAGTDRLHVLHVIASDPQLRKHYQLVFGPLPQGVNDLARFPAHARPDKNPHSALNRAWAAMSAKDQMAANLVFSHVGKAIEAYERKLVIGQSPFDRFVTALKQHQPTKGFLSAAAKRGLKLFVGKGQCTDCHSGPMLSDGQFHNLGLAVRDFHDTGREAGISQLKGDVFNAKGPFADAADAKARQRLQFLPPATSQLGSFKTPSLRNVALTAPYMHDGRFATLQAVMAFYAKGKAGIKGHYLGKRDGTADLVPPLSKQQQADLIAFLDTLNSAPLSAKLTKAPKPY
ncbi:cytochrome-c peroxidase [Gallaecimonas mangrovi]|uniref:cytochrome-c peroxidase n=1 Tax=Gallaecimonas mangrovi TaxID=2291597 RepID=UPI0012602884|nr:cytochrome c peroxidase [Gallaecimonas mangrovi]